MRNFFKSRKMSSSIDPYLGALSLTLLIAVYVTNAKTLRYRETVIYNTDPVPEWAVYDETPSKRGMKLYASNLDDGPQFDPLGICIPYFQLQNAQVYVGPDGYLAFEAVNPCKGKFCAERNVGHVSFNKQHPTRGDFPIIGLYVTDLNPSSRYDSSIYKILMNKTYTEGKVTVATVEYKNVFIYSRRNRAGERPLNGQVEIWLNGTIILRYKSVPNVGAGGIAGSGILWTKTQRYIAPSVVYNESTQVNIRAIRYDPEEDICSYNSTCGNCDSKRCTWCDSLNECVSTNLVVDMCPSPTTQDSCRKGNLTNDIENAVDGVVPQAFYSAKITYDVPILDIRNIENVEEIPVSDTNVSLSFKAPFFYSPPIVDPASPQLVDEITIRKDGSWSMVVKQDCAHDSKYDVCIDGKYKFVIAPYAVQISYNIMSSRQILMLESRPPGSLFCPDNQVNYCVPMVVIQYSGYVVASESLSVTFQVSLDADGNINMAYIETFNSLALSAISGVMCSQMGVWNQYPEPVIGVIFDGVKDTSSVIFPWPVIHDGTQISLSPIPGCNNCHRGGSCNYTSRKCVCAHNYDGKDCDVCAKGFFGPLCKPCEPCFNGGRCDDGKTGSGYCTCSPPHSGRNCDMLCDSMPNPSCSPKCKYGYCDCGKCVCNKRLGFYGAGCTEWLDPCGQYSLDGCDTCVNSKNIKCNYCLSEYRCVADSDQEYVIGSVDKCGSGTLLSIEKSSSCRPNPQHFPPDSTFAIITVISVFSTLGLCSCITLVAVCMCRKPSPNLLVVHAVPGVANFSFPSREREVVRLARLPVQGIRGKTVQGIPLKQIQMKQLVKIQREARRTGIPIHELYPVEHT